MIIIIIGLPIIILFQVHTGGTTNLVQILPEIENSCGALEVLFNRVDHIEALVARVRRDVTAMEARMDAAEAETGPSTSSDLSLRNLLKPLFSVSEFSG
jgi:hypothetical protein